MNALKKKKSPIPKAAVTAWLVLALSSGCATHPSRPAADESSRQPDALADSGIDIHYVLGHSHRKLVARANESACTAQTFLDHQLIREASVDRKHYRDYFAKVSQFVSETRRTPATQKAPLPVDGASEGCRSPFTITVRLGGETQVYSGCRGMDEGALSHLVRDGEFLMYSRSPAQN